MVYQHDGTSHFNGIRLELEIVEFINRCYQKGIDIIKTKTKKETKFMTTCVHEGGTNNKSDAKLIFACGKEGLGAVSISIKRKKYKNNKPSGTFDLINTTLDKFSKDYEVFKKEDIQTLTDWLESKKEIVKEKNNVDDIRDEFANECNRLLDTLNSQEDYKKIVKLINDEFFKTDVLIIGRVEEKKEKVGEEEKNVEEITKIYVSNEKDISLFEKEKPTKFVLKKGRGKASRRLCFINQKNKEIKTPFRIRLVLNNGLSAYYGLSNANSTSVLTIKIQVDDVTSIIKQMDSYDIKK